MRGWWTLKIDIWDDDAEDRYIEPNEADLEHIAEVIKQGYISGEIIHDEEERIDN